MIIGMSVIKPGNVADSPRSAVSEKDICFIGSGSGYDRERSNSDRSICCVSRLIRFHGRERRNVWLLVSQWDAIGSMGMSLAQGGERRQGGICARKTSKVFMVWPA